MMPYEDERAGLAAIRAIAEGEVVESFRQELQARHNGQPLPLPPFQPCPAGTSRTHILAIDGSEIYAPIPGALPSTEAGLVSLGVVVMDLQKLETLQRLPESGSVNPRLLRETERGQSLGLMLPGMNAGKKDGTDPRTWFRQIFNSELEKARVANEGGETFAQTLHHLLGSGHQIDHCPNPDCSEEKLPLPAPGQVDYCQTCGVEVLLSDGLRIHTQFMENASPTECHSRVRDTLEILALVNSLRYLVQSERGRIAIGNTAFVMDGQLAAMGTIAVLAQAVHKELQRIQCVLSLHNPGTLLLVMSGVKTGPFVDHAAELDRAPEPGKNIRADHVWLPNNAYIRANIVARYSNSPQPWGAVTHYGRPVVMKTKNGQRLVLNIAQPEAVPPLTNAAPPLALPDAVNTAGPLGVGSDQFLVLRRAHNRAAIPLRAGTDLIRSLAT